MRTLCLFGSYDPETPRVQQLKAGWEAAGGRVIELHAPVWPAAGARAVMAGAGVFPVGRVLSAQRALWAQRSRIEEADVVLVPYPGHFDMWVAARVCRLAGKPLAFDPFVSLHETAVEDRRLFPAGSLRARLARAVDRIALRLADRVLADTAAHADYFAALGGIPREKVAVVPLGANERLFRCPPPGREGGCEVLFYGTMIPLHGVSTILDAARLLVDEPIRFHLVGTGQYPIERELAAAELPNVRWTRQLAYEALPGAIAEADICLGIFGTSEKAARVVPHKVYEAAAMGRAIITADTAAVREAFPEDSLVRVPAGDPVALAEAIRDLSVAPARRSQLGAAARARFEAAYDTEAIGRALAGALGSPPGEAPTPGQS